MFKTLNDCGSSWIAVLGEEGLTTEKNSCFYRCFFCPVSWGLSQLKNKDDVLYSPYALFAVYELVEQM